MGKTFASFHTGNVNHHVLLNRSGDHVDLLHTYEWNISKRSLDSVDGSLVSAVWNIRQCNSVNCIGRVESCLFRPLFPGQNG
jgi:hypothetical protein